MLVQLKNAKFHPQATAPRPEYDSNGPPRPRPASPKEKKSTAGIWISVLLHGMLLFLLSQFVEANRRPPRRVTIHVEAAIDEESFSLQNVAWNRAGAGSFALEHIEGGDPVSATYEESELEGIAAHQPTFDALPSIGSSQKGAGAGSGKGRGGAGGNLFDGSGTAGRVVYVIDRSGSMKINNSLDLAKAHLVQSLHGLPDQCRFQVLFFNSTVRSLDGFPEDELISVSPVALKNACSSISGTAPSGETEPRAALLQAIQYQPEVIYFLTDAHNTHLYWIREITRQNLLLEKPASIHVIHFQHDTAVTTIQRLADLNRGTYKLVETKSLK